MVIHVGYPGKSSIEVVDGEPRYKYPGGLNLKPDSPLHNKIKDMLMSMADASKEFMSPSWGSWDEVRNSLTAYIPIKESEKALRNEDPNAPISIVVPVSYATLETLLTPLVAVFLVNPMFKYRGTGPEDVAGGAYLERAISTQCSRAKVGLNIHTMLRDGLVHGFGGVSIRWKKQMGYKIVVEERSSWLSKFMGPFRKRITRPATIYEGSFLENIDPYLFLPDVNVPVYEQQKGGRVGWVYRTNRMALIEEEVAYQSVFNAKYLSKVGDGRSKYNCYDPRSASRSSSGYSEFNNPIDVVFMYVKLIPAEIGLSKSEVPETWLFALASDQIIIMAQKVEDTHGMFPNAVCAPDYDGYTLVPPSKLEVINGLQVVMNFLFNSHIENVRKAINDMLVVDPKLIDVDCFKKPGPGKLIYMNEMSWGRGVRDAVMQLNVSDVTANHLRDAGVVDSLIQNITSATDPMRGAMRKTSERVSATEFQGTRLGALGRIEKMAKIISMQSMHDIAVILASNLQQYGSEELYIKLAGNYEAELKAIHGDIEGITISPEDLVVDYDVVPFDGSSLSGDNADIWLDIFRTVGTNQELQQTFDITRIFRQMVDKLGVRSIGDFIKKGVNVEVKPNEEVSNELAKGNLSPLGGFNE